MIGMTSSDDPKNIIEKNLKEETKNDSKEDTPKKKKRGRKSKEEKQQEQSKQLEDNIDFIRSTLEEAGRNLYGFAAFFRGDHWNLTDEEARAFSVSGVQALKSPVLQKYLDMMNSYLPLATFVFCNLRLIQEKTKLDHRNLKLVKDNQPKNEKNNNPSVG